MLLQHLLKNLKDYRFYGLSLALVAMLVLFIKPQVIKERARNNFPIEIISEESPDNSILVNIYQI